MDWCDPLREALNDPDLPLVYWPKFREIVIRVLDGGSSGIEIHFCPFCGSSLPSPKRDEWFDRLWELGLETDSPNIPLDMRSDEWWRADLGQ